MTVSSFPPLPPPALEALARAEAALRSGRLQESAGALREARGLATNHPEVPHRMAKALAGAGRPLDALAQHLMAYRLAPTVPTYRTALAVGFRGAQLEQATTVVTAALLDLLQGGDVGAQDLVLAAFGLLKQQPALQHLFAAAAAGEALAPRLAEPEVAAFLQGPLWLALLTEAVLPDAAAETLFTALRRLAFERLEDPAAPAFLLAETPDLLAALACQATATRWAWEVNESEAERIAALRQRLEARPPAAWDARLILPALYGPLPLATASLAVPEKPWPLRRLHQLLVSEPERIAKLLPGIEGLSAPEDATSVKVAAQYEENPYPRWRSVTRQAPRPCREVLREMLQRVASESLPKTGRPRLLVAGCGTGQHAVKVASRYAGAEVLAVDLSRASLAYATLRTEALGLANLRFAQADILCLPSDIGRFDLIECSGVLHHMADPTAGLQQLVTLLAPRGLLKLGLYSRLGRQRVQAARALLAPLGLPPTAAGLRRARTRLRSLPQDHPAKTVTRWLDFYDLDGLRDLLFHVREVVFDLPGVARLLARTELEFLGFEFPDPSLPLAFRGHHPHPSALLDLGLWDTFEQHFPDSFASMYQFWCRPRRQV